MARVDFVKIEAEKRLLYEQRLAAIFNIPIDEAVAVAKRQRLPAFRINDCIEHNSVTSLIEKGKQFLTAVSWYKNAYWIRENKDFFTHSKEAEQGQIVFQNPSSFLPVLALDPQEKEIILDMCAAPGAKTSHIAALSKNKAIIYANDAHRGRAFQMKKFLASVAASIEEITTLPAQSLVKLYTQKFDKILLDAPCSGEGMMDIYSQEDIKNWSLKRINRLSKLQKKMILSAFDLLKKGGTLVYSTCTFAPEENEEVISYLLKKRPDAGIITLSFDDLVVADGLTEWQGNALDPRLSGTKRVIPDGMLEGFYLAKITKYENGHSSD